MDEEKTFKQQCGCSNCGNNWVKTFDYGDSTKGGILCPNCGRLDGNSQGLPDKKLEIMM